MHIRMYVVGKTLMDACMYIVYGACGREACTYVREKTYNTKHKVKRQAFSQTYTQEAQRCHTDDKG